jgi:hypothetical protein
MRFLFLLLIVTSYGFSYTQQPDSLKINFPDSLALIPPVDSLLFSSEIDSVFSISDSLQSEIAILDSTSSDSLYIDTAELRMLLEKHLAKKDSIRKNLRFPFLVNSENFHLRTPFNPNMNIIKNCFSIIPFSTSTINTIQNYQPFYNTNCKLGFIDFSNDNYDLPVAVTESFLGLGDIEMNHAFVSFKKGSIIGLENLNLELSYLGQDGVWLGKREQSANLDVHLFYDFKDFRLHGYRTDVDQKIGSNKLYPAPELFVISEIKEQISDTALLLENPYLNLGYRTEKIKVDTLKREQVIYLISKELTTTNHSLKSTFEFIDNKSKNTEDKRLTFFHHSNISFFELNNNAFYEGAEDYFIASEFIVSPFVGIGLIANFQKYGKDSIITLWQEQRIAGGLIWQNRFIKAKLLAGKDNIADSNEPFLESDIKASFDISNFSINPTNWFLYRNTDSIQIPSLQSQTDLEFVLNLEHNNAIKLALNHVFISEYGYVLNSFQNLNARIGFQVTERFNFNFDIVNFLGTEKLFGYPTSETMEGSHFNFNIQWIFIN